MKFEFFANVKDGKLHIINRKVFDELLKADFAGKDLILTIEQKKAKRSDPQNRYYWGAVIPIIQDELKNLGHRLTKDEVHEFLKHKFLKQEIANEDGVSVGELARSTASLNKSEFADYIAEIAQWAAEILNTVIPEPLEQVKLY